VIVGRRRVEESADRGGVGDIEPARFDPPLQRRLRGAQLFFVGGGKSGID